MDGWGLRRDHSGLVISVLLGNQSTLPSRALIVLLELIDESGSEDSGVGSYVSTVDWHESAILH